MDKNRQIEEMARVICDCCRTYGDCSKVARGVICNTAYREAEALKTAGYRKASEVAEEIFAEIENLLYFGDNEYLDIRISVKLAELKKKYTEEGK